MRVFDRLRSWRSSAGASDRQGSAGQARRVLADAARITLEPLETRQMFGWGFGWAWIFVPDCGCNGPKTTQSENPSKEPTPQQPQKPGLERPGMAAPSASSGPIRFLDGKPEFIATDLNSAGFDGDWGLTRSWSAQNNSGPVGNGWSVAGLPYLVLGQNFTAGFHNAIVQVVGGLDAPLLYSVGYAGGTTGDGTPQAMYGEHSTLSYTAPTTVGGVRYPGEFRLTDEQGNVLTFFDLPRDSYVDPEGDPPASGYGPLRTSTYTGHDDEESNPIIEEHYPLEINQQYSDIKYQFGAFKSYTDAYGNPMMAATYDTDGRLTAITRTDAATGLQERIRYEYAEVTNDLVEAASGVDAPVYVSRAWLDRRASSGVSWEPVKGVSYDYYTGRTGGTTPANDPNGRLGDLKLVTDYDQTTITGITRSGSTATVTTAAAHQYRVGERVTISGASQAEYNGTFTIISATSNTFAYTVSGSPASPATAATGLKMSAGAVTNHKYYRYYTVGNYNVYTNAGVANDPAYSGGVDVAVDDLVDASGFTHDHVLMNSLLRTVVEGEAFDRLAAANGLNLAGDVPAQLDALDDASDVNPFAQHVFRYEANDDGDLVPHDAMTLQGISHQFYYSVVEEVVQGDGCSVCSAGLGTYRLDYFTRAGGGLNDIDYVNNTWTRRFIESLPDTTATWGDNDRNIVYLNSAGQVMLRVAVDVGDVVKSISALTWNGSTGVMTVTSNGHGYVNGDVIAISSARDSRVNGVYTVTVIDANQFTFTIPNYAANDGGYITSWNASDPDNAEPVAAKVVSQSRTFYKYNEDNHIVMVAGPEAVTGYDESKVDLLDGASGNYAYLSDNQGRIDVYAYYGPSETGGPEGYLKYTAVQHGELDAATSAALEWNGTTLKVQVTVAGHDFQVGDVVTVQGSEDGFYNGTFTVDSVIDGNTFTFTPPWAEYAWPDEMIPGGTITVRHGPTLLESYTYEAHTAGGFTTYQTASTTSYDGNYGRDGHTTTYSYTWVSGTAGVQSVTVSHPIVSTAHNGPGGSTHDTDAVFYDTYGRPVWTMDAEGHVTYTAYDVATGAVIKQIIDVKYGSLTTAEADSFGDTGWTAPSSGLHLVTSYEVDGYGRTTKVTDPNGNVVFTVYDDAHREVRVYRGSIVGGTFVQTGLTEVTREYTTATPFMDGANAIGRVYIEYLTTSATPDLYDGRPTGREEIAAASIQSLTRELTNDAGQKVEVDAYFSLGGQTYSASTPRIGSASNDSASGSYHQTLYTYDGRGNVKRVQDPTGTITRYVYDGLGRLVQTWVGTDDSPTSGFWSPTNTTGTNLVKVEQREYDANGNVTKVTQYPGGSAAERVTEAYYDWRGRLVASKAGVQGSESSTDGVGRLITYLQYDNQDRVVSRETYAGDGVTVTTTGGVPNRPSYTKLRAQTTTSYDEQGRAYRTDTFNVSPAAGTIVGSYSLHTDYWYDRRGNVIKVVAPGGLVTKYAYDGAGRNTVVYQSDGGGDAGWGDADDVTGDIVLQQNEYTYDANGNVTFVTTRERFHNAGGTGALGETGGAIGPMGPYVDPRPAARVSYRAFYYDAANRVVADVDFGTNGGTLDGTGAGADLDANNDGTADRPSKLPGRSDTVLVTGYSYGQNDAQSVRLTGIPTGGTFTLTFNGQTTAAIAYNASASAVQSALEALSTIGSGNVAVSGSAGAWTVAFTGALSGKNLAQMTATSSMTAAPLVGDATGDGVVDDDDEDLVMAHFGSTVPTGTLGDVTGPGGVPDGVVNLDDLSTVMNNKGHTSSPPTAVIATAVDGQTGRLAAVTDPRGIRTLTSYDLLGRTTRTVAAFTSGLPGNSTNQTTEQTYDGSDHVLTMKAVLPGGAFQTTAYIYGVSPNELSDITSNDLLAYVAYPFEDTGVPSNNSFDAYMYNALGEKTGYSDRKGTTHFYTYDVLGRLTADTVAILGPGVDGAVRKLGYSFDSAGRAYEFTSYDASNAVVNQVRRLYNGLGQLTAEYQEHDGAVDGSTLAVQYAYSEMAGGANHSRLTSMTYPGSSSGIGVVNYAYAGGIDDSISRVSSVMGSSGESYEYLGLDTVVTRSRPVTSNALTYVKQGSEPDGDAGDQYTGLDRFSRVVDQRWTGSGSADRFQYGYDRDGNVTFRDDLVNAWLGQLYSYDQLNRLTTYAQGELNGTRTGFTGSPDVSQAWTLDAAGNWTSTGGIDNTFNAQNQQTDNGSTPISYDANGNEVEFDGYATYAYDAWNRLVAATAYGAEVDYAYDAMGRRVTETVQSTGDETHLYYSKDWQVVQERDGTGTVLVEHVWSATDTAMMVGSYSNGFDGKWVFVQQDANGNVTSLVDTGGAVVERYAYDPYGQVTVLDANGDPKSASDYGWKYLFQGQRYDATTYLYDFRHRAYDPYLGRFLQQDPTGYVDGANLYQMERGNPVVYTDPYGTSAAVALDPDNPNDGGGGVSKDATNGTWSTGGSGDFGGGDIGGGSRFGGTGGTIASRDPNYVPGKGRRIPGGSRGVGLPNAYYDPGFGQWFDPTPPGGYAKPDPGYNPRPKDKSSYCKLTVQLGGTVGFGLPLLWLAGPGFLDGSVSLTLSSSGQISIGANIGYGFGWGAVASAGLGVGGGYGPDDQQGFSGGFYAGAIGGVGPVSCQLNNNGLGGIWGIGRLSIGGGIYGAGQVGLQGSYNFLR